MAAVAVVSDAVHARRAPDGDGVRFRVWAAPVAAYRTGALRRPEARRWLVAHAWGDPPRLSTRRAAYAAIDAALDAAAAGATEGPWEAERGETRR